jgi:hypothetical protein
VIGDPLCIRFAGRSVETTDFRKTLEEVGRGPRVSRMDTTGSRLERALPHNERIRR